MYPEGEPKPPLLEINTTLYVWKAIVLGVKCNSWNSVSASLAVPGIKWKPALYLLRPALLFESLYGYVKERLMKWIIDTKNSRSNTHFRFLYCVRGVLGVQPDKKNLFSFSPLFFACPFFFPLSLPMKLRWGQRKILKTSFPHSEQEGLRGSRMPRALQNVGSNQ